MPHLREFGDSLMLLEVKKNLFWVGPSQCESLSEIVMERLRILDRDSFLEDGLKGAADNLLLDVGFMVLYGLS